MVLSLRRIAEVKKKERSRALEEIIYCLIIQKFIENRLTMIPPIVPSAEPSLPIDSWPNQEYKLQSIHSPDALEMIESHISLVLGERSVGPLNSTALISKLKLGKLYAASIMYGYFLKRVDERFQLERSMKTLNPKSSAQSSILDNLQASPLWDVESLIQIPADGEFAGEFPEEFAGESKLRSYVMYLDAETLQRYATMRSTAAISLIEKQTQALFGRPDIRVASDGSIEVPNDEMVSITFSGLSCLVLEAVAFGSFLWDSESFVDARYHFLSSWMNSHTVNLNFFCKSLSYPDVIGCVLIVRRSEAVIEDRERVILEDYERSSNKD